jgi:hypothetical protein
MSEATVLVQSVELKEGVSQKTGKPYRRVILTDGNGNQHSSFEVGMYEIAKPYEGKQAIVDAIPNGKFSDLLSVKPLPEDPKEKLGTGDYVRGQTAPADKKSIHASVALKEAVASLSHTIRPDDEAVEIHKRVAALGDFYFSWLQTKSGFLLDDPDVPF